MFCFTLFLIILCWSPGPLSILCLGKWHLLGTYLSSITYCSLGVGTLRKTGNGSQRKMQMPILLEERNREEEWNIGEECPTGKRQSWERAGWSGLSAEDRDRGQHWPVQLLRARFTLLPAEEAWLCALKIKRSKISFYSLRMMLLMAALHTTYGSYTCNHVQIMVLFESGGHTNV